MRIAGLVATAALTIAALAPPPAAAQDSREYLCVADRATGFNFSDDQWRPTSFTVDASRYVVRPSSLGYAYGVSEAGDDFERYTCEQPFSDAGNLFCDGAAYGQFVMNAQNNRFVLSQLTGYWTVFPTSVVQRDDDSDSLVIEMGTCSPR
jgi:hypothetical protein